MANDKQIDWSYQMGTPDSSPRLDKRNESSSDPMTYTANSLLTNRTSTGTERPRRAKIVATLGPASSSTDVFRQLVRSGLDVARLNFSHGTHAQKGELIRMVRQVSREENKPICILADLQGPKIRTGK